MNFSRAILCTCVLVCISLLSQAQTEKGKFIMGGSSSFDFSSSKSKWKTDNADGEDGKSSTMEFSPQVGYFVIDNLALGVELPVNISSQTDEDDDKFTTTTIAVAPFARIYFGEGKAKPYLQGAVGVGNVKMKYDVSGQSSEDTSAGMFLYQAGAGVGVFFNEYVGLDFGLGYTSVTMTPEGDSDFKNISSGIGINIGFTISL